MLPSYDPIEDAEDSPSVVPVHARRMRSRVKEDLDGRVSLGTTLSSHTVDQVANEIESLDHFESMLLDGLESSALAFHHRLRTGCNDDSRLWGLCPDNHCGNRGRSTLPTNRRQSQ